MAILKCLSGEVEVRLQRIGPNDGEAAYFEEHEELEVREYAGTSRCTRYIVPESTHYAIEIILKSGFDLEYCEGVRIKIYDKATDNFVGQKLITGGQAGHLTVDKSTLIKTVSGGIAGGSWVSNAQLYFKSLTMDESLDKETDVAGVSVESLGGLQIRVARCSEKAPVQVSKKEFERQLARFEGKQVVGQAQKIDESSYNKDGITHAIGLSGGAAGKKIGAPTQVQWIRQETDKLCFDFICRSAEYLENNPFMKSPLPLELRLWDLLTPDQRITALATLQAHKTKEHMLEREVAESGKDPKLDTNADKPISTIGGRNNKRAKGACLTLQYRRIEFEVQQKNLAASSIIVPVNIQLPHPETQAQSPEAQVPPSTPDQINATVIRPSTPIPKPIVIVLDDSPPRSRKRTLPMRSLQVQAGTEAEPIDLDPFEPRPSSFPTTEFSQALPKLKEEREHKIVKLGSSEDVHADSPTKIERLSQELQRRNAESAEIARLYREAEDLKAKIEDMEENKDD